MRACTAKTVSSVFDRANARSETERSGVELALRSKWIEKEEMK